MNKNALKVGLKVYYQDPDDPGIIRGIDADGFTVLFEDRSAGWFPFSAVDQFFDNEKEKLCTPPNQP